MQSVDEQVRILRASNEHLRAVARRLNFSWSKEKLDDERRLHNKYAQNLFAAYVSRESELMDSMFLAIDSRNYLTYALCGRALIEIVATLRWYIEAKYRPLLDSKTGDISELLEIDDRHLRGGRFNWKQFLEGNYEKLASDAASALRSKKTNKKSETADVTSNPTQINVVTCIDHWTESEPMVKVTYDLFCELVHPNTGSTLLMAGVHNDEMWFNPEKGKAIAEDIFRRSFPLLCASLRGHSIDLMLLLATMFDDDEMTPN